MHTEPLVGREDEVNGLNLALDLLATDRPAYVAIEGEPGIGKTRLLDELCAQAERRGALVLAGRAAEFERDVPFSVVVDCLDAYVASHQEAVSPDSEPELRAELAAMLPSMREFAQAGASPLGDERYRSHRAVRRLLERLARSQPLVVALDDLHWADSASVELIASLLRRRPDAPVLLAFAFRPGQAPERLSAALAVPWVTRLQPAELSETQVAELLPGLDPGSRAAIYREGGGNPFYLEQLARADKPRRLRPAPNGHRRATTGVPPAVAAALAEELDALSAPAHRMLRSAAVAGEPFEPDLAAEIAELSPAEGLAALDELIGLDLVRPTQLPRRFIFRHPLVRRAVYEAARGGWKLGAHARAAAELAARGAAPIELAHHVEHSARRGDEQAIAVLLHAGRAAAPRAPAAAAHQLEAALRLLPDDDTRRQIEVRVSLASALRSAGELGRCRATLLEAIERLPADARARRVELTASCAAVEHWLGRHDDAHRRLLGAWEELADPGSAEAAALGIELAIDGLYALDTEQALDMGGRALETARELRDPVLIAAAAAALSLCEVAAGRIAVARGHVEEAAARVDRLSDAELAQRLEALYHVGLAGLWLGRIDGGVAHLERGLAISRATGDGRLLVPMTLAKAAVLELRGRLAEAIEACEAALEAARLTDNPHYIFWALWELGWRLYLTGDLDAAIEACEESGRTHRASVERSTGSYMRSGSGEPGWTLGVALIKRGELERGLELMLAGVGGIELEHINPNERPWAREHLTLAELARGRPEVAEVHARRAAEEAARLGLGIQTAVARRAQAAVALAKGEALEAARLAEEAIDAATPVAARLDIAFSRRLLGRALVAADRRQQAIEELRQAARELDACGSVRERDETRRELRRLGARVEPRRPAAAGDSGIPELTAREFEIAELVTDRKTNREIAAELFLSGKTVESHLRNIFVKLGVSSRVAVARTVEREREARADRR